MNLDKRLRDTYDNLDLRARQAAPNLDDAPGTPDGGPSRSWMGRPGLALAALAVVAGTGAVAVGLTRGDDGQQIDTATPTSADGTDAAAGTPDGDPIEGTAVDGGSDDDGSPGATGADQGTASDFEITGERYRVATAAVAADTGDPFLNVRVDPDAGADLLAKLPATYTGLAATGEAVTAADGGDWIEVVLRHPVAVTEVVQATGRPPTGWVNTAFVEALPNGVPVTTDEVPACAGGSGGGTEGAASGPGHLYALESAMLDDSCLRIVATFGDGQAPFEWYDLPSDTGPASQVPDVLTTFSGGTGVGFDLGLTDGAWRSATDTVDGVYAVRNTSGALDLLVPTPTADVHVHPLPDRGIVVIDLELDGDTPPLGPNVALLDEPWVGAGSITVVGVARPFEATLGVTLTDASGDPIEAVFSGSDFLGTVRTDEYGVGTNDWTEAWGRFAVQVEGLAPGDYVVRLDAQGGGDDPQTLDLPVTITDGGEARALPTDPTQQKAALDLIRFGEGRGAGELSFADEVTLALGPQVVGTLSRSEAQDGANWSIEAEEFEGFVGPFSALDALNQAGGHRITAGPIPRCAAGPRDWPTEFSGLDQVNIEPVGIDSCIQWSGVHLFFDDNGDIAGVALDLFGP